MSLNVNILLFNINDSEITTKLKREEVLILV